MIAELNAAMVAGYERMSAWADLLDAINVFPVADADTGRNLKISLAPLRDTDLDPGALRHQILAQAVGNSGNIAAAFLGEFLNLQSIEALADAARSGCDKARNAIADPKPGTMLSVFDALNRFLEHRPFSVTAAATDDLLGELEETVKGSVGALPELRSADVVDAGALGMFLFLEGTFEYLTPRKEQRPCITEVFGSNLRLRGPIEAAADGYCISSLVECRQPLSDPTAQLAEMGDSVVAVAQGKDLKVHIHSQNPRQVREALEAIGRPLDWNEDRLAPPEADAGREAAAAAVHLVTDAAGSMTRQEARRLNMTLLDSYIIVDDRSCPETLMEPEALYRAMRAGSRVSTAQASAHEKHEAFRSILGRFPHGLYLSVGSVYTGNYDAARHWCRSHDPQARLQVLDSTAASGRLGLMARIVGRHAREGAELAQVVEQAIRTIDFCDELVFLDQLKYLAAGGRVSKPKGFFGDLLGLKPIIRPGARGVQKIGVVRRRSEQLPFALDYLRRKMANGSEALILLQYTDNEERVRAEILPAVAARYPAVEILVRPLSLTSGAHMGPGTWALAFHPTTSKVE